MRFPLFLALLSGALGPSLAWLCWLAPSLRENTALGATSWSHGHSAKDDVAAGVKVGSSPGFPVSLARLLRFRSVLEVSCGWPVVADSANTVWVTCVVWKAASAVACARNLSVSFVNCQIGWFVSLLCSRVC